MEHLEKRPGDEQLRGVSVNAGGWGNKLGRDSRPERFRAACGVLSGRLVAGHGSVQDRGRDRHQSQMGRRGFVVKTVAIS